MSKIAPNLQWFHLQSVGRHRTKAMAAELRALIAVARAARRNRDAYYDALPLGASSDPLVKALARLARASSPVGGRGSK